MITFEELINNELKSVLDHEPTAAELGSLSEFLSAKKIRWFIDLELAISDWKNALTKECQWCGERYLESEMEFTNSGLCFCCDQCKKDYKTEHGLGC